MYNNHSRSFRAIKYISFSVERGLALLCLQSPQSHDAALNWSKVTIRITNLNSKVIHLEAVQVYDTMLEEKGWPAASLQVGISSVNQLPPALLSALFRREWKQLSLLKIVLKNKVCCGKTFSTTIKRAQCRIWCGSGQWSGIWLRHGLRVMWPTRKRGHRSKYPFDNVHSWALETPSITAEVLFQL